MNLPLRPPEKGPVSEYLHFLDSSLQPHEKAAAREARASVRRLMLTPDGLMLMDLLEKSTTQFFKSPLADPRACDALNAQRFIALDLMRIASDDGNHDPKPRKPSFSR
jgi:hypothetical protein